MRNALLASCTLLALAGAALAFDTPKAPPKPAPDAKTATAPVALVQRIAVIGASVSAGFGLGGEDPFAPSKIQLANVIEASLSGAHDPIDNQASTLFFNDANGTSKHEMEEIQKKKPTLVVGVDYLFWFAYGDGPEDKRIERIDKALKGLESLSCTVLLGDLPDMTAATKVQQPMLTPPKVPQPETLKKINDKLHAWAGEHKNFVLVPMAAMTTKLLADEEIAVRGNKWPKGSYDLLMQGDHLHTTLEGTSALWLLAVDALLVAKTDVPAGAFDLDAESIVKKVRAGPKATADPKGTPAGKGVKKPPVKDGKKP